MEPGFLSLQEARNSDLVDYLQSIGFSPKKIRGNDYWYLSPLRVEKTPSFKVNRKLNVWYDHGSGQGGNIIDFGMLYHNCSFKEMIDRLKNAFSFHPQIATVQQHSANTQNHPENALEPKIKVVAAKPLTHPFLCSYLSQRKIPFQLAKNYCEEVHYELNGKRFFAIGFKNNSGGYEFRNAHFKGSSSPKDITSIEQSTIKQVAVFEGFFNFLSYLALEQKNISLTNFLVLNSLSFFEKSRFMMEKHETVNLYLDRDEAGMRSTAKAMQWDKKYNDQSHKYKDHKDLNEYLMQQSQIRKKGLPRGRHF